ncbi:hypothetical protein PRZ48_012023 [Zasmidium cellare]|uniref:Glucose-methanol-choline oxidoreductase N-terminal domain-containing protein n=1 Tax=Zasmidium cellare TaxID=395010 RepID=A0ABR0E814_ZASCE|nr:hypothetical protein PRZ48_012023 [Zasmidium cellare]
MDGKFTWKLPNGNLHVGRNGTQPHGAQPLGILYPRTGTLGGCGNHNALNLLLPPDRDWEKYAGVLNDSSWGTARMRTYFEKIENCNYLPKGTAGHGFNGWLHSNTNDQSVRTSDHSFIQLASAAMSTLNQSNATIAADVIRVMQADMNSADPDRYQHQGVYTIPGHIDTLRRRSSSQTYIDETIAQRWQNGSQRYPLTVSTTSLATKIVFSNVTSPGSTPKAVGVDYLYGSALYKADPRFDGTQAGVSMRAMANKEVIIAGGAFNTPQLLKLSGIGPAEELQRFNITVVKDLPAVGSYLTDNNEGGVEASASADFRGFGECTNLAPGDPCWLEWERHGTVAYGQGPPPMGLLARSSVSESEDSDLFMFGSSGSQYFRGYYPGFSHAQAPPNTWWFSIVRMQSHNHAGTVKLRSADPQDPPEINFNTFSEGGKIDVQALTEGVELARSIFANTMQPTGPFNNTVPGPPFTNITEGIRAEAWGHHAAGSCRLGLDESTSCADTNFKVHGVQSLRIVDASIFPHMPGAFPILPVFMIAEKAFDVISRGL